MADEPIIDETIDDGRDEFAVDPVEALRRTEAGEATLVDVRTDHEWDAGHVPGSEHIQLNDLMARAGELSDGPLLFICRGDGRSEMAAAAFREAGRDALRVGGGVTKWHEEGLPLDPEDGYVAASGEAAAVLQARERGV